MHAGQELYQLSYTLSHQVPSTLNSGLGSLYIIIRMIKELLEGTQLTEGLPGLQNPESQLVPSAHNHLVFACPERTWPINTGARGKKALDIQTVPRMWTANGH